MRCISILVLGALLVGRTFAQEPTFVPPSAEQIGALLEFSGPVSLALRIHTREELARKPEKGIPRAGYSYSDPAHTSESISISVYHAGDFLREKRAELMQWISKHATSGSLGIPATGGFRASDGRSIFQFPMSFGPGGWADGALLKCRNPRYEIVVVRQTDHHKNEDPNIFAHHVRSRKELREVIEAMEALVLK
jgi:hypothetical protein